MGNSLRNGISLRAAKEGTGNAKAPEKVFVAGATGKLGSRIVAELVKQGVEVYAASRNPSRIQETVQELVRDGWFDSKLAGNIKAVAVDVEMDSPGQIASKLSGCTAFVQAIGASEANFFDTTGPARVDGDGAIKLVEAAKQAKVNHYVMISSLGTGSKMFTWPAGILNLFWGVLFQKAKAEKALKSSGIPYTILRPGGMERPKDDFKYTHNLECYTADSLSGGVVSRRQVAELAAAAVMNPDVGKDSTFEVIAQTPEFAPNRTMTDAMDAVITEAGLAG
eukprot:CAMPEP_0167762020 /NCGR_PEP_ID=MMETSP0110_2-20121227/12510_1 /TAXON_ID=629695 /ORGANISM="Gymnochlora sp., Strain CCMP2014" /LENGTH=279 /DNA_ID=CAMNT_0007648797 /DNA_START=146 /DNA_END=985 /DNA_ORIENTATION=+